MESVLHLIHNGLPKAGCVHTLEIETDDAVWPEQGGLEKDSVYLERVRQKFNSEGLVKRCPCGAEMVLPR